MTKVVISTSPNASIEEVAKLLIKNRIHGVPVIENNKLIGMLTETDFFTKGAMVVYLPEYINFLKNNSMLGKISSEEREKIDVLLNTKVRDVMTVPCVAINENSDISEFIKLIREERLKSIPVVDAKDDLVGIITMADVISLVGVI